jgi:MFS family permease
VFPQFGAPIEFVCSNGVFLLLTALLDDQQFLAWGWRIPFIASAVLVLVGLWVRLRLAETPDFMRTLARNERVQIPIIDVFRRFPRELVLGLLAATSAFLLFYILTVFALSWGTSKLGYSRQEFLELQMLAIMLFALAFAPLFGSGNTAGIASTLVLGLVAMGLVYGPLGSAMGRLFPTSVRYTGTSLAFDGAGILGASVAPYAATWLASHYGLWAVGAYMAVTASVSLLAWQALGHLPD